MKAAGDGLPAERDRLPAERDRLPAERDRLPAERDRLPAERDGARPAVKPVWRGVSHQIAFFVALVAGALLFSGAHGSSARLCAVIYGASLATQFGVSALYHRPHWEPRARAFLRRLDHSAIFVLIAGTFTPFCVSLGADGTLGLQLVWGGAALGIAQSLFWVRAPKPLVAVLAIALSWAMTPILWRAARGGAFALLMAGGVLYSAGGLIYSLKRPDPSPAVFGYHEVFHAFVIAASICHFAAVAPVIRAL